MLGTVLHRRAALQTHFRLAGRRWPEIADFLHDRLGQQTHRASMHLAMLHLPRVEDRITALFADLAERFGRTVSRSGMCGISWSYPTALQRPRHPPA